MSELRGLAAVLIFGAGVAGVYFLWGRIGMAGAGAMMLVMWAAIGTLTGWWMGRDAEHDSLIEELGRRLKRRRAQGGGLTAEREPPSD